MKKNNAKNILVGMIDSLKKEQNTHMLEKAKHKKQMEEIMSNMQRMIDGSAQKADEKLAAELVKEQERTGRKLANKLAKGGREQTRPWWTS